MSSNRTAVALMVLAALTLVCVVGCKQTTTGPTTAPAKKSPGDTSVKAPLAPATPAGNSANTPGMVAPGGTTTRPVATRPTATRPTGAATTRPRGARPGAATRPTAAVPAPAAPVAAAAPAKAVSQLVLPSKDASPFYDENNFVTKWLILGPFTFGENDFGGGEQQGAVDKEFVANEAALDGTQPAPDKTKWQEVQFKDGTQPGQADLDKLFNGIDHAAAYAVAFIDCPSDITDAKLMLGSDDYIKVWVNGKQVFEYKTARRGSDWDQDTVSGISLKKGMNRIVVKCVDVVSGWDFYFRIADKDGQPMAFKPAAK